MWKKNLGTVKVWYRIWSWWVRLKKYLLRALFSFPVGTAIWGQKYAVYCSTCGGCNHNAVSRETKVISICLPAYLLCSHLTKLIKYFQLDFKGTCYRNRHTCRFSQQKNRFLDKQGVSQMYYEVNILLLFMCSTLLLPFELLYSFTIVNISVKIALC